MALQDGTTVATGEAPGNEHVEVDSEVLAAARREGWRPKDEYDKDPETWVDAATFVERGKVHSRNLLKEVKVLKAQIATFEGTKEAFKKFHAETIKAKDKEFGEAIATLRQQLHTAIRDGEDADAVAIEDRIELLKTSRSELKADVIQEQPQVNPELDAWIDEGNEWFREDENLQAWAVRVGKRLRAGGETVQGRPFLDKIKKVMEADFPHKFNAASRRDTGAGTGSSTTSTTGGRTERDLPEQDRALMNKFIKEGWHTKESFLKSYFNRK